MLHVPSFNMGRAAGITAKSLDAERPMAMLDIPALEDILSKTEGKFFFPLSYVEGYFSAFDYPDAKFSLDSLRS